MAVTLGEMSPVQISLFSLSRASGEKRRLICEQDKSVLDLPHAFVEESSMSRRETDFDLGVVTETEKKLKKPPLYKVLLHNDDYTTKEFVVQILQYVFHKEHTEAVQIMLHVHKKGIGVAGVYTYEVAETKVTLVEGLARQHEYPLKCTMEEA